MPENRFWIFWFFFAILFRNFPVQVEHERNWGQKIFYRFLSLSLPVLAKNNAGKRFLNFLIFLLFFSEFSFRGRVWTEFGTKIFFLAFSTYLIPFSLKIMPERVFWIFVFFFFTIFFGIFLPKSSGNGIRD